MGLPRAVAASLVVALMLLVFSLVAPVWLKFFSIPALMATLGFSVYAFRLGDDWDLRGVMSSARRERKCVTSETWTLY